MKKSKAVFLGVLFFVLFGSTQVMAIDIYGYGSYWEKVRDRRELDNLGLDNLFIN